MKRATKVISLLLCMCLSVSAVLVGCKEPPSDISSSSQQQEIELQLDKTEYVLYEDEEFTLHILSDSTQTAVWSSSDTSVASVTNSGRVLAKKEGTAVITASVGNSIASCTVTIKKATGNGVEIQTDKTAYLLSLADGQGLQIQATYFVDDGTSQLQDELKTLEFKSLNEKVATVSSDGVITPIGLGTTDIVISCEDATTSVTADVYTDGISTPTEWMDVIKNSCTVENLTTDARYFLENDIDFLGVEYDIGQTAVGKNDEKANPYHFGSEINGNFHKVKNITAWKKDVQVNPDNHQSIFGRTIGATVKNIAFENVTFTSPRSYGLSSVMMNHISTGKVKDNQFTNVFADFSYALERDEKGVRATGVTDSAYNVYMDNVFISMRAADGSNLLEKFNEVYGFARAEWVWYGGSLSNVIVLMEGLPDGLAMFINDEAGDQKYKHAKTNCFVAQTVIQASYYAHQIFTESIWDLQANQIPVLKERK